MTEDEGIIELMNRAIDTGYREGYKAAEKQAYLRGLGQGIFIGWLIMIIFVVVVIP